MLDHHTTRDGLTILIAEMNDTHLLNTIKLFAKDLPALAEHSSATKGDRDKLYNRPGHVEPEDAARMWRNQVANLYAYLAEAIVRTSIREEAGEVMSIALGRIGAIEQTPRLGQNLALSSGVTEDNIPF